MDANLVILSGAVVSAAERTVGQSGRTLTELRLAVARQGRKGEAEPPMTIPITLWDGLLGIAVRELSAGTPVTVVGRLQSREWNNRLYLELVGERVTVDVAVGSPGPHAPSAPAEAPAPARRPRPTAADDPVPF